MCLRVPWCRLYARAELSSCMSRAALWLLLYFVGALAFSLVAMYSSLCLTGSR